MVPEPKRSTGEGNRALLGLDEFNAAECPPLIQLADGSFQEVTPAMAVAYEKLDALQRLQLANKLSAKAELEEMEKLQRGGSDPRGLEQWDQAMRRIGRGV